MVPGNGVVEAVVLLKLGFLFMGLSCHELFDVFRFAQFEDSCFSLWAQYSPMCRALHSNESLALDEADEETELVAREALALDVVENAAGVGVT